jgi:hypothetical protein
MPQIQKDAAWYSEPWQRMLRNAQFEHWCWLKWPAAHQMYFRLNDELGAPEAAD